MILLEKFVGNKGENSTAFGQKVEQVCQALGIHPNWLMMVMYNESRLNAQAVNKQKGDSEDALARSATRATGLLQFMPDTAKGIGTTTQALYRMDALQQLDYVYKYYRPYANRIKCYTDLYFICFFPLALGKPDNWVLQTSALSASAIALQNPSFDLNKDRQITVGELKQAILNVVPKAYLAEILQKKTSNSDLQA